MARYSPGITTLTTALTVERQQRAFNVPAKSGLGGGQYSYPGGAIIGVDRDTVILRFSPLITGALIKTEGYDTSVIGGHWNQNNTVGSTNLRAFLCPTFREFTVDGQCGSNTNVTTCHGIKIKAAGALVERVNLFNVAGICLTLTEVDSTAQSGWFSPYDDVLPRIRDVRCGHSYGGLLLNQADVTVEDFYGVDFDGVGIEINATGAAVRNATVESADVGFLATHPTVLRDISVGGTTRIGVWLTDGAEQSIIKVSVPSDATVSTVVKLDTAAIGTTIDIRGSGDSGTVLDLSASGLDTANGGGNKFVVNWSGSATKVLYPGGGTAFNLAPGTEVVINGELQSSSVDVVGRYALTENTAAAASTNAAALQAGVDTLAPVKKWFFRGGSGDTKPYYVDRTIQLKGVGAAYEGIGRHAWATDLPDNSSILLMSADDHATTFNGTTRTATATSATNSVLTLVGRTVAAADKWNSFQITGGTNFTAGWYTITDVNTSANTWTLDRNCTTGSAASAMTGFYCPELIQNAGTGHRHTGLNFEAKKNNTATLGGRVGYHVLTGSQVTGSGDYPTGQHYFEHCSFTNFDYALLCGAGMAQYGEKAVSFYGYHDGHADNITL